MNTLKSKSSENQHEDQTYEYRKNEKDPADEEHECWASDSGSSSGSYYSNSTRSAIEWESEISPNGEVFYIESLTESLSTQTSKTNDSHPYVSPPPELTRRRSTRGGKFMRLIKRRESYRHSVRMSGLASELRQNFESISRLNKEREATKDDCNAREKYTVNIWVDPDRRHKLGRRATACEAYLGMIPKVSSDRAKVIVAGLVPDGEACKNKDIKVGDCLLLINSKEVYNHNIDALLSEISAPANITCQFQRNSADGNYESLPTVVCPNQSALARQLVDKEESKILMDCLVKEPVGVIYLKTSDFSETESELQGVIYSFPKSKSRNVQSFLLTTKGAFITLNHMLPDIIGPQPISTTLMTTSGRVNVIYFSYEEELLLICLPENCCNKQEAMELSLDIVRTLAFTHESISKCFSKEDNHTYLDHLFYLFFSRLHNEKLTLSKRNSENLRNSINNDDIRQNDFNFLLPVVNSIQLPRDAQIQIDAALNEMEAMDYRDWNQDPLKCQRLYTVLGSCLYHKKYLLGSHLPGEDLIQIHSFLRRHGLINLINSEQVKSLVIWKRIYPSSCVNRKTNWVETNTYPLIDKWFLLIVGCGHDLLAVILESGGCTAVLQDNFGPDIFYVEEAQDTLKHIKKIGVSMLAEKWINANAKPEVILPQKEATLSKMSTSIAENLVGFIKTNPSKSLSNLTSNTGCKLSYDGSSITKNKTPEEPRLDINSAYSIETSRGSPSQDSLSQVSEMSDQAAPILGRRATRERANVSNARHSDDSDSDFDNDQSGISDISNIRENLLNQAEYIIPKIITTGEKNSLLHFVHLDLFDGVLVSSKLTQLDTEFSTSLNFCSQTIHKLLSDTKRYKKLLNHDTCKSVINKSLVAIKEHGVLFEWQNSTFWVVGRLYTTPKLKELYICYQDNTPQNLIEMAFRLQSINI